MDYGTVTMMKTAEWLLDLVGPTINICAKINHTSKNNNMVIGNDLYQQLKNFHEYKFKKVTTFSFDLEHPYPVYSVNRNKS